MHTLVTAIRDAGLNIQAIEDIGPRKFYTFHLACLYMVYDIYYPGSQRQAWIHIKSIVGNKTLG